MKIQNGVGFANSVSVCAGWPTHLCVSDNRAVYVSVGALQQGCSCFDV